LSVRYPIHSATPFICNQETKYFLISTTLKLPLSVLSKRYLTGHIRDVFFEKINDKKAEHKKAGHQVKFEKRSLLLNADCHYGVAGFSKEKMPIQILSWCFHFFIVSF
jgi:hypothetical protein